MTRPGFAGFGSPPTPSTSTAALQAIDSSTKTFVNKDFVKNIAWLNNSVDTLSQWSQKLQAGVEQANRNIFEQVEGIFADLFVMFAGLEPTGIHVGDLKYVIQGIGALLGINPDTPFPLNLAEAAWNIFSNYIIPAHQFSDVIFDAIDAWALDLGLSENFINSLTSLRNSFENLWNALDTNIDGLFDALSKLLGAFLPSLNSLGDLWNALVNLFDGIPTTPLHNIFVRLIDLGIPFIDALTAIVNAGTAFLTPLSFISGSQIGTLGTNFVPPVSDMTTIWSVGSNTTNAWVFDETQSPFGTIGSFTTLGTGTPKVVRTQEIFPAKPGGKFTIQAQLRWVGIPSGANDFGIQLQWYADENLEDVTNLDIPAGHGATGGWAQSINESDVVVPQNVNGVRVAARVGPGISSGQVWVSAISGQIQGGIDVSLISGIEALIRGFLSFNWVFDLFSFIPIGNIGSAPRNLLVNPNFETEGSLAENDYWEWDESEGINVPGSAKTVASGQIKELWSNQIRVEKDNRFQIRANAKWANLIGAGNLITVSVVEFSDEQGLVPINAVDIANVAAGQPNSDWQEFSDQYIVTSTAVKAIRISLRVNATATAGEVWFDELFAGKVQLLSIPLIDQLPQVLSNISEWVQNIINEIIRAITGLIPVGGGGLNDLFDAIESLWNDAQDAISQVSDLAWNLIHNAANTIGNIGNNIIDGIGSTINNLLGGLFGIFSRTEPLSSANVDELLTAAQDVVQTADSAQHDALVAQSSAYHLQALITRPRISPRWLSTGPWDDVSFPIVNATTTFTPELGTLVLIPITAEQDREYRSVKFAISSQSMGSLRVGLYRFDIETQTASLEIDLGDVKPQMTFSSVQAFNTPPFQVSRGETVYIGILQVGNSAAPIASTPNLTLVEAAQEVPHFISSRFSTAGLSSLPTQVPYANIIENPSVWGALGAEVGEAPPILPVYYFDNFNRPNGPLGEMWEVIGTASISSNAMSISGGGVAPSSKARYILPFATVNQKIKIKPTSPALTAAGLELGIRVKDANNYVGAFFPGGISASGRAHIYTVINGVRTERAVSDTFSAPYPTHLSFLCEGANYWIEDQNGTNPFGNFSWQDTGSVFPVSGANRFAQIGQAGLLGTGMTQTYDDFEMMDYI